MILDDVKAVICKDNPFAEVDLKGKRFVKCPYCGVDFDVKHREISHEKLRHLKNVEILYEKMRGMEFPLIINFRWCICSVCGKKFIGKDEFTKKIY